MSSAEEQQTAWDQVADGYARLHDWPDTDVHYGPLAPNESELGLLGPLGGARVLVLGCGDGANAVALARQGAVVTAGDISPAQLALARQRARRAGVSVDWLRLDAADLGQLPAAGFDLILAVYVFPYVREIGDCLGHCQRLLRPGGRLLFSQDHPLRACYWDSDAQAEGVLPARHYLDETPQRWPFADTRVPMTSHPRPIARWVALLGAGGLALEQLLELPLPPEMADAPWADEYTAEIARYLPQTLIACARKRRNQNDHQNDHQNDQKKEKQREEE